MSVKKFPRWDDDPVNGTPECCIHWRGGHDVERFRFWIGHPDRLRVEQEDGRWFVLRNGQFLVACPTESVAREIAEILRKDAPEDG